MTDKTELDVSVEEVTHAVAEISKMDAVIADLHQKYAKVIFTVDTPSGMKAAKEARKEIREPRYLIENIRKDGKKPILDLGRKLDARASEMKDRLLEIETPIHNTITEEETRVERERQERIEAEAKRVEAIQERIGDIRDSVQRVHTFGIPDVKQVRKEIDGLNQLEIDDGSFDEFESQALDAKTATLARLNEIREAAELRDQETARIAAEREELAKLRAAEERRQAEEKAKREAEEAKQRAEAEKQRRELEAQRKKQEEEQAKIDAENKRIADERAEIERQRAEERLKAEAMEAAEKKRKEQAEAAAKKAKYPGEKAIISALSAHFDVSEEVVVVWINKIREGSI